MAGPPGKLSACTHIRRELTRGLSGECVRSWVVAGPGGSGGTRAWDVELCQPRMLLRSERSSQGGVGGVVTGGYSSDAISQIQSMNGEERSDV